MGVVPIATRQQDPSKSKIGLERDPTHTLSFTNTHSLQTGDAYEKLMSMQPKAKGVYEDKGK